MSSNERQSQNTPLLRQYHEIKKNHPGTILFFRLGDFYELFFDDAILGAREMEITLTARHKEKGNPVPMCGVPYHSAPGYITKLVRKGYRVAICDQVEDSTSSTKLVKREVVRVITPGTALENQLLENKQNNYLAALSGSPQGMGLAILDLSTGEFLATQFTGEDAWPKVIEQLEIFSPSEIIYPNSLSSIWLLRINPETKKSAVAEDAEPETGNPLSLSDAPHYFNMRTALTEVDDWTFGYDHGESLIRVQLGVASLDGFGLSGRELAVMAAGGALHYVNETQKTQATHISEISYFEPSEYLVLDATTLSNLEVIAASDGVGSHSLFGVMDETMTGMGARLLRQWLIRPSVKLGEIENRLDAVEELKTSSIRRDQLRKMLERMSDLERLSGKITLGRVTARELIALKNSIEVIPLIKKGLFDSRATLLRAGYEGLDELEDLKLLIGSAISDDPPAAVNEPGMIRAGYHAELDELRSLAHSGKSYIAAIEARERGRTGIASLKVKFNNVFRILY
ncbi:MAG: DNA mismatch repair protein MutS [Acidobacteria bacterium]|nr:DNA mismatch repair protein MutS [Acidobacteriota bacterium]